MLLDLAGGTYVVVRTGEGRVSIEITIRDRVGKTQRKSSSNSNARALLSARNRGAVSRETLPRRLKPRHGVHHRATYPSGGAGRGAVDRPTETNNTSEPWKAVSLSAGTPPEWGTLLSMARSRLSDIERGYVTPSLEELARTAAALQTDRGQILS